VVELSMDIYWFERDKQTDSDLAQRAIDLENSGLNGVMYPYGPTIGDFFTKISRMIDINSTFKYIVAIRTYTISPQYLSMICASINDISKKRIMLNFLTGYISEKERKIGGILSETNDHSSNIERSNYMLKYAKDFREISNGEQFSPVDFFVSTTNKQVFDECTKNDLPILIPYLRYKEDWFSNTGQKIILMIAPVIGSKELAKEWECDNNNECRHPKETNCANLDFFTEDEFIYFLNECERKGVYGILLQESDFLEEQYSKLLPIIKSYISKKK
jgi:hypothetical protein